MPETKKSIAELEQVLAQQKKSLKELQARIRERREHLEAEITKVNEEIASLSQELGAPPKPRVSRKRRAKRLPQYILEVLKASSNPMSAAEIAEAVTKAGYSSSSKNFVGLVRRTCYLNKRIYIKERGKFAIKGKK
jgi:chromosome segregation ATPase